MRTESHTRPAERSYDVIVVGAGPTGLATANVIAQHGHSVALFERYPTLYNLPRAGHLDNEILRVLQEIGCLDALMQDAFPIERVPLLDSKGAFLLELVPAHRTVSSFPSVMMYQPALEEAMYTRLKQRDDRATIYLGWMVDGEAFQDQQGVRIRARPSIAAKGGSAGGDWLEFQCQYLLAADGSGSSIRQGAGIDREDFGFNERWLDVDLEYRRPCDFGPPAIFGDPKRPHFFSPIGKTHHRYECKLLPGESSTEFSNPRKAWELLGEKGVTAGDVGIVRQAVYTFEYRMAHRWRDERILFLGDAAHTICPLLGQGLSSGIRDAANLGWKLDLVLRGIARPSILDSYEIERRPHVRAWADLSLLAADFICITDAEKATARDDAIRAGAAPALRPPPVLTTGLFDFEAHSPADIAGRLLPQRAVCLNGRHGLLDDLTGSGFLLLTRDDPRPYFSEADHEIMGRIGIRCFHFAKSQEEATALRDETGEYHRFFDENQIDAIILRPDRYIFGTIQNLGDIGGAIDKLRRSLSVPDVTI